MKNFKLRDSENNFTYISKKYLLAILTDESNEYSNNANYTDDSFVELRNETLLNIFNKFMTKGNVDNILEVLTFNKKHFLAFVYLLYNDALSEKDLKYLLKDNNYYRRNEFMLKRIMEDDLYENK